MLKETNCTWIIQDPHDQHIWETDCGEAFVFEVDGPEQNNFKFCPFCGKPIIPEAT